MSNDGIANWKTYRYNFRVGRWYWQLDPNRVFTRLYFKHDFYSWREGYWGRVPFVEYNITREYLLDAATEVNRGGRR